MPLGSKPCSDPPVVPGWDARRHYPRAASGQSLSRKWASAASAPQGEPLLVFSLHFQHDPKQQGEKSLCAVKSLAGSAS